MRVATRYPVEQESGQEHARTIIMLTGALRRLLPNDATTRDLLDGIERRAWRIVQQLEQ